jgi:hypothetical protein
MLRTGPSCGYPCKHHMPHGFCAAPGCGTPAGNPNLVTHCPEGWREAWGFPQAMPPNSAQWRPQMGEGLFLQATASERAVHKPVQRRPSAPELRGMTPVIPIPTRPKRIKKSATSPSVLARGARSLEASGALEGPPGRRIQVGGLRPCRHPTWALAPASRIAKPHALVAGPAPWGLRSPTHKAQQKTIHNLYMKMGISP